jgi:hypothetical protein
MSSDRAPRQVYESIRTGLSDEQRAKIVIIHGTDDETVPYANSCEFAEVAGLRLITVEGGDHRLNNFVLQGDAAEAPLLQQVIEQVLPLHSGDAGR